MVRTLHLTRCRQSIHTTIQKVSKNYYYLISVKNMEMNLYIMTVFAKVTAAYTLHRYK